ncbi:PH domain-containing protein [Alteromonas oceanisediminis]|uniref:PH domain-containing protein n=1 Tax=Alteromonas oceanisediminis TaxID=2836180 RepID=UPI001BD96672|nr:PH domain-containing protein [Alteromonas oceanisediminis]
MLEQFSGWQRVKPVAMLYFIDKLIRAVIANVIVLVPMFLGVRSFFNQNTLWGYAILSALFCLLIAYVVSAYLTFQFKIEGQQIDIRRGLFSKLRLNIPFDKIQDVKIEQPFYYRMSDSCVVIFDTAGSAKQEATIVAMTVANAETLREVVQQTASTMSTLTATETSTSVPASASPLLERNISDLVIHGITNNRVFLVLAALSPFIDDALRQLDDTLSFFNVEQLFSVSEQGLLLFSVIVASTIILFIAFVLLLSIGGSIISFHGYRLFSEAGRLKRQSGLLTRYQTSAKVSRIQHIEYKQNWLDRVFGRVNLTFKQIKGAAQHQNGSVKSLIVPSVTPSQASSLAQHGFAHPSPYDVFFSAISPRYIMRYMMILVLPSLVMAVLLIIRHCQETADVLSFLWLLIPLLLAILITLRWYRWGYHITREFVYIRNGLLGTKLSVYPLYKSQNTCFQQSVLQKKQGLASAKLNYASHLANIPFVPEETAATLVNAALTQSMQTDKAWM